MVTQTLDWDDELRDDGQDLGSALGKEIIGSLSSQELVRLVGLSDSIEKDRQVVMIVEFVKVGDDPLDLA